eukprot:5752711-Ditylum_brightwellii.AAC.1
METSKSRVVAIIDLQHRDKVTDIWSSSVSIKEIRILLAMTAKLEKRVKKADFIGDYIEAMATGRFIV